MRWVISGLSATRCGKRLSSTPGSITDSLAPRRSGKFLRDHLSASTPSLGRAWSSAHHPGRSLSLRLFRRKTIHNARTRVLREEQHWSRTSLRESTHLFASQRYGPSNRLRLYSPHRPKTAEICDRFSAYASLAPRRAWCTPRRKSMCLAHSLQLGIDGLVFFVERAQHQHGAGLFTATEGSERIESFCREFRVSFEHENLSQIARLVVQSSLGWTVSAHACCSQYAHARSHR